MAEGYVVRRSGSGSGSSELNIFTGTTPPASNVGVFAQTTAQIDHKYIVPSGFLQGQDVPVFEICQNPWPATSAGLMSSYPGHDGTDITYFIVFNGIANGTVYSHNISSDLYTNIGSFLPSGTNMNYYNGWNVSSGYSDGVLYVYGWGNSVRYGFNAGRYSIDSDITSMSGQLFTMGADYNDLNGSDLCTVYDGRIYVGGYCSYNNSTYTTIKHPFVFMSTPEEPRIYSFVLNNSNRLNFDSNKYSNYQRCPSTKSGNNIYCVGSDAYSQINMDDNTYTNIGATVLKGYSSSSILDDYVVYGYCMFHYKDFLYQFKQRGRGASTTIPVSLEIGDSSIKWQNDAKITLSSATSTVSTTVDTGRYIMIYNASGFTLKFDYLSGSSLEPNSLAIVVDTSTENLADIITGDSDNVRIPVKAVYYYDGTNLTTLDAQVRVTGGEWTNI